MNKAVEAAAVPQDDGPDGMLAYALAIKNPSRDDPNWPLPSFDAMDWAEAFCKMYPDMKQDVMLGWFANALMRGYDEHAMRAADAARAVGDDELDMVFTGVKGGLVARLMRDKLRAAGMKVVRA